MGNIMFLFKKGSGNNSRGGRSSNTGRIGSGSRENVSSSTSSTSSAAIRKGNGGKSITGKSSMKNKYSYIPDTFSSLEQVTQALREAGLESSNLIVGIDFTKSNEWTGKVSFNNRSLHSIGDTPNPYEKAISVIGKTLAPFDEDNLIPCFGFGDATTHDQEVFSFHDDQSPCHGFEEVQACYRKIVPNLKLSGNFQISISTTPRSLHPLCSGPTSYGAVVDAAVDIVERNGGQYHVLVIIADGQVTRSVDIRDADLSTQEKATINAIVNSSSYPLSIVLVGVGDGPWDDMKNFDDKIPAREFDNFQFVNFTSIMSSNATDSAKETAFALAALMEVPIQYKATKEFGLLGRVTGRAKRIVPRRPPVPYTRRGMTLTRGPSELTTPTQNEEEQACPVCLTNKKDTAFSCGHLTCRECSPRLSDCPICRQSITSRIRIYT